MFEPRLGSYYEDVDLACRLRRAGWTALWVSAAQARHAGSASGERLAHGSRQWIYGNRHLVLARLWGRAFWPRLPRLWLRDAIDLWQALGRGEPRTARAIVAGWARAARALPSFGHLRPPGLTPRVMRRFPHELS
jgi:GT2 family glycosyltransferase